MHRNLKWMAVETAFEHFLLPFCNLMVVNLQLGKNISMLSAEQYLLGMITVT
jgi:hypothetical protein